jgi:hypothetical protein
VRGMPARRGSLGNYSAHREERERERQTYYDQVAPAWMHDRRRPDGFSELRCGEGGELILYLLQNRFFCAPARFFIRSARTWRARACKELPRASPYRACQMNRRTRFVNALSYVDGKREREGERERLARNWLDRPAKSSLISSPPSLSPSLPLSLCLWKRVPESPTHASEERRTSIGGERNCRSRTNPRASRRVDSSTLSRISTSTSISAGHRFANGARMVRVRWTIRKRALIIRRLSVGIVSSAGGGGGKRILHESHTRYTF